MLERYCFEHNNPSIWNERWLPLVIMKGLRFRTSGHSEPQMQEWEKLIINRLPELLGRLKVNGGIVTLTADMLVREGLAQTTGNAMKVLHRPLVDYLEADGYSYTSIRSSRGLRKYRKEKLEKKK